VRLFCFPFAGGTPAAFLPWHQALGAEVELNVALLPGRSSRLFEPPLRDMDLLVATLAQALRGRLDKPFAFFGHSLGALVAFEVARALRRQGLPGPGRLWVSGAEGPQTRSVKRRLHDLPDAELVAVLRGYNGTPVELLDDAEMMELLLPGLRADFCLAERYAYRVEPPLDLPFTLLTGDADPYVEDERAAGWARESSLPLQRERFDGDHFFLYPHQAAITASLAAALADAARLPATLQTEVMP